MPPITSVMNPISSSHASSTAFSSSIVKALRFEACFLTRSTLWKTLSRRCPCFAASFHAPRSTLRCLFTVAPVTLRATSADQGLPLAELLDAVLAEMELRAAWTEEPLTAGEEGPQLEIAGEIVARGRVSREHLRQSVRRSITDW